MLQALRGKAMTVSGAPDIAYALQVKSAEMANNQQRLEGQAVLQLLQSAKSVPAPSSPNLGNSVNTYA